MLARIRVLLRRRNSLGSTVLEWGKLSLNSSTHEVIYDRQILNLTPKEYRLLELFLRSGNHVLTRDMILDRLWDIEEAPSENTVTAHIKDLRRKLKKVGADANLIETVYGVGYRLKSQTTKTKSTLPDDKKEQETKQVRQKTTAALAAVWHRYQHTHQERLAILEKADLAWQSGTLQGQLLQQAQWAAHKLAGALGVFGCSQGSYLAQEMEQLLNIELAEDYTHSPMLGQASPKLNGASPRVPLYGKQDTLGRDQSQQFSELLAALKSALNQNLKSKLNPIDRNRPVILAVDNQPQLVGQLIEEMTEIGMRYERICLPQTLKKALQTNIDAVILDFSLAECRAKTWSGFASIINHKIPLPVILFTDHQDQDSQKKIARLGGHVLLQQSSLDSQATKAIVRALQQSQHKVAKVLAVDDDPQILAAINNLLDPLKIELTILDSPLNFWQTINRLQPDLLILDVQMPYFSGIELCQLLRNDLRWRELPILFFTVYNDLDTVHRILTAGANDCISKVISPTELVPKIFNHLNRGQLLASLVT
ncbi:MAG: response regulator [Cyanobacteria bacterium J06642_3]